MSKRLKKKRKKEITCTRLMLEWFSDLRGYLLEADYENIDKRIIIRQAKRRLKLLPKHWYTATRLSYYVRGALTSDN